MVKKYYLCIKTYGRIEPTFFYPNTYTYWNNFVYEDFMGHFTKDRIYVSEFDNGIVIDDSMQSINIESLGHILIPYEFNLTEEAKKLIDLKEDKGDFVKLTPTRVLNDGRLEYLCRCRAISINGLSYMTSFYSDLPQYETIVECYRRLRTMGGLTEKLRRHFMNEKYFRKMLKGVKKVGN
jgi:hypothetical protein